MGLVGVGGLQGIDFLHLDRSTISPFGTVAVMQSKLGCSTALHAFSPTYFLLAWRSHGVINQTAVPGEELDAKDQKKHTENQKISLSKTIFFSCLVLYSQPPQLAEIAFFFEVRSLP